MRILSMRTQTVKVSKNSFLDKNRQAKVWYELQEVVLFPNSREFVYGVFKNNMLQNRPHVHLDCGNGMWTIF